jgi:hypothetical protein
MYKPAKHVSFDADKKLDQTMMVDVNAVAAHLGQDVSETARSLLEEAAYHARMSYHADTDVARRMMWPH